MILVLFDFVTQSSLFSCVYSVELLYFGLGCVLADFPQLLLYHSVHTFYSFYPYVQKEEEEVGRSRTPLDLCSASDNRQKMQKETGVSMCYHHQQPQEEVKSDQAKEAFDILKKVSHDLKHNFGSFSKKFRLKKKFEKISLKSQVPAQLIYILLNSPEPLQIKLNEILSDFHNQLKSKLKICTDTPDMSKYSPLESPDSEDEGDCCPGHCSCKEALPNVPTNTTEKHFSSPPYHPSIHHVECMRRT